LPLGAIIKPRALDSGLPQASMSVYALHNLAQVRAQYPQNQPRDTGPKLPMSPALPRALAALCLGLMLMLPIAAQSQGSALEISMDELVDDTWSNLVIARGNVEIRFFGEILLADEVAYDRRGRKLTAKGNVTLQEADGKVTRTETLGMHDELRDAFVAYARRQNVRIDR
jgi:lipopolysaccharide assembly outer membrane protein LptD (OstA)